MWMHQHISFFLWVTSPPTTGTGNRGPPRAHQAMVWTASECLKKNCSHVFKIPPFNVLYLLIEQPIAQFYWIDTGNEQLHAVQRSWNKYISVNKHCGIKHNVLHQIHEIFASTLWQWKLNIYILVKTCEGSVNLVAVLRNTFLMCFSDWYVWG